MRKWLNNYFEFTQKEQSGLMGLLILIALVTVFPRIYNWLKPVPASGEKEAKEILHLVITDKQKREFKNQVADSGDNVNDRVNPKVVLFNFDPNVIGLSDWQRLGLSEKQAQGILNYRAKGGRFRKKVDLQKMYSLNERLYMQLAPYVVIPETEQQIRKSSFHKSEYKPYTSVKKELKIIGVNEADTTELKEIKGIGSVFARRIWMYRERIGGFHQKEQLMEVFGIDSLKYLEIKDQVYIDQNKVKKININTAELTDFKNHPYIRYKQINALIEYRKQHGNYSNIADLNKVVLLTPEIIGRLAPYLMF